MDADAEALSLLTNIFINTTVSNASAKWNQGMFSSFKHLYQQFMNIIPNL